MKYLIVLACALACVLAAYVPVGYNSYAYGGSYSGYPYAHPGAAAVLYRARRGIVAPVAYTSGYAPAVSSSAYAYPYSHHAAALLYRKRRALVNHVAYSSGYVNAPVVPHSAVPYYQPYY